MITRFLDRSVRYVNASFSGRIIKTEISMVRDWRVEVLIGCDETNDYKTSIENRKLVVVFDNYLVDKEVTITRKAVVPEITLDEIYSLKFLETWYDSVTEAIQDLAIFQSLNIGARVSFTLTGRLIFKKTIEIIRHRLKALRMFFKSFLINTRTYAFSTNCPDRPDKNAAGLNTRPPVTSSLNIYSGISSPTFDTSSTLTVDKTTGISRIGESSYSMVKSLSRDKIVLYRRMYEGINPVIVIGDVLNRQHIIFSKIGNLSVQRAEFTDNTITLYGIFPAFTGLLSIYLGNAFIPLTLKSLGALEPSSTDCGITDLGVDTTLQNWLSGV